MNVIFHIPNKNEAGVSIYRIAQMAEVKAKAEIFRDIRDLSHRLSRPADTGTIAVILINNQKDLNNLYSIRHLLSDLPFILILPHREKKMTSIGYDLGPRFLTYMDGNLHEAEAVLEKMIDNYSNKH